MPSCHLIFPAVKCRKNPQRGRFKRGLWGQVTSLLRLE